MAINLNCIDAITPGCGARLDHLPAVIGRGEEADVCIRDTWASRMHCRLFERDGRLFAADLHSSNGTRVNGAPITETELRSGDRLTVGITTFRVTWSRLPVSKAAPVTKPELVGT